MTDAARKRRGMALFIVIPIVLVLAILGAVLMKVAASEHTLAYNDYYREKALYLAEAAIQEATLITQYCANRVPSKSDSWQAYFLKGPFITGDISAMCVNTQRLVDELGGNASLERVTVEFRDVKRFAHAESYWYNWWPEFDISGAFDPEQEKRVYNPDPSNIRLPAYLADFSTNVSQGPPHDFYGTLVIEAIASYHGFKRHIKVSKDVKVVNITPLANEYSLYVRQGPFGDTQTELENQIFNEFNQGGSLVVYSGLNDPAAVAATTDRVLRDPTTNEPVERRIHIKGDYIINLSGDYYRYDPNNPKDPNARILKDDAGLEDRYAHPHGFDLPTFDPDLEKTFYNPCFGRSPIPYPRCVLHRKDHSFWGKELHVPAKAREKYFDIASPMLIANNRVFNSGTGTMYQHRTSLFGNNVKHETGIEGQVWGRYKQYKVGVWAVPPAPAPPMFCWVELHGGTEGEIDHQGKPTDDLTSYFPYKCVATTRDEQFHWWDGLVAYFMNFVTMGPIGYYIGQALGIGKLKKSGLDIMARTSPEIQKLLKQYKIVGMPTIIGGPPVGSDMTNLSNEPYFSNAKFMTNEVGDLVFDYLPYVVRYVEKFEDLLGPEGGLALDGIIGLENIEIKPAPGKREVRYKYRGGLYTRNSCQVTCSLKSIESEADEPVDMSYLLLIKKGREYTRPPIPSQEKIQVRPKGDILQIDASVFSTNSLEIPAGKLVAIKGNLVCDRIRKSKIEGDLHVIYDENNFNNHYNVDPTVFDPSDVLFNQVYLVSISPQISSWEDMNLRGK